MPNGDGLEPHEGEKLRVLLVPFDGVHGATDRVRPVEHDHPLFQARAGPESEDGRPHEGVVASANVLKIDHQEIDVREVFVARATRGERLAVETAHRDAPPIAGVGDADHVLRFAAVSVLRAEDDARLCADADQNFDSVHELPGDRRRVGKKRELRSANVLGDFDVRGQSVESGVHEFYPTQWLRAVPPACA
jgi:hypothetical protein